MTVPKQHNDKQMEPFHLRKKEHPVSAKIFISLSADQSKFCGKKLNKNNNKKPWLAYLSFSLCVSMYVYSIFTET